MPEFTPGSLWGTYGMPGRDLTWVDHVPANHPALCTIFPAQHVAFYSGISSDPWQRGRAELVVSVLWGLETHLRVSSQGVWAEGMGRNSWEAAKHSSCTLQRSGTVFRVRERKTATTFLLVLLLGLPNGFSPFSRIAAAVPLGCI